VEAELAALRSQMNPHFIFNSLNAIQDFIFQHKLKKPWVPYQVCKAYARHSQPVAEKFVTVEEECDLLQMYLELEALRFNHSFEWNMNVGNEIISSDIMIPSMLLQPVVEQFH